MGLKGGNYQQLKKKELLYVYLRDKSQKSLLKIGDLFLY